MTRGRAEHWDDVYASRAATELSWYEHEPATSLRLVERTAVDAGASVIDVGGGESYLVDRLLDHSFRNVTVLDVSQRAIDDVRARLGDRGATVHVVVADVIEWEPQREYDVWHDRAVFHFLTDPRDRTRYVEVVERATHVGSSLVIGAFADDGPTHCSGLPVSRYAPADLESVFSGSFTLVSHEREEHVTPAGIAQPFTWAVLRRA